MPDRPSMIADAFLDISTDTTKTAAVQVPQWARYGTLFIPTIDNAAITLELIEIEDVTAAKLVSDQDTSWITVYDQAESSQVMGASTGDRWVDISNYVQSLPKDCFIRAVCGAAQDPDVTFVFAFRGA